MRNQQVVEELKQRVKPYLHVSLNDKVMAQSSFSNTMTKIEAGLTKIKTMQRFFGLFGYQGTFNDWSLRADYVQPPETIKN